MLKVLQVPVKTEYITHQLFIKYNSPLHAENIESIFNNASTNFQPVLFSTLIFKTQRISTQFQKYRLAILSVRHTKGLYQATAKANINASKKEDHHGQATKLK